MAAGAEHEEEEEEEADATADAAGAAGEVEKTRIRMPLHCKPFMRDDAVEGARGMPSCDVSVMGSRTARVETDATLSSLRLIARTIARQMMTMKPVTEQVPPTAVGL